MERLSVKRPGYDCRDGRCQHTPKGDHGIHGEEWIFVMKDGDCALSLLIFTNRYPPTVEPSIVEAVCRLRDGGLYAADLALHTAFRTDADDGSSECRYVEGGTCYGCHATGLGAERFWVEHGHPEAGFDQPESFWRALESECRRWAADYRARRLAPGLEHVACPRCGGSGHVEARTVEPIATGERGAA